MIYLAICDDFYFILFFIPMAASGNTHIQLLQEGKKINKRNSRGSTFCSQQPHIRLPNPLGCQFVATHIPAERRVINFDAKQR